MDEADKATLQAALDDVHAKIAAIAYAQALALSFVVKDAALRGSIDPAAITTNLQIAEDELRRRNEHDAQLGQLRSLRIAIANLCGLPDHSGPKPPS